MDIDQMQQDGAQDTERMPRTAAGRAYPCEECGAPVDLYGMYYGRAEPAPLDALDIRALDYALPDGISYLATESVQRARKGMVNWIADRYVAEAARLAAGDKGSE